MDFGINQLIDAANGQDFRGNTVQSETMIVDKEVEHQRLTVQIVEKKPFLLTVYFKYEETNKQITPLRNLRLSLQSSESSQALMAIFKNVNVGEEE
jgi:ribosomal 30S subunit maturation factor RimM